jgi:HSP90 family molecular chaperone
MFLPEAPPYSQFDSAARQKGVKLYVRRVFITEELDALLPKYLAFLRGVVDSDDLPLNLSRETLQEHKALVRTPPSVHNHQTHNCPLTAFRRCVGVSMNRR